jgi:hypothetical protein
MATTVTELVWQRIKATAQRDAPNRHRLTRAEAEKLVNDIILTQNGPFPDEAVEFYARELIRLIDEGQSRE